MKPITNNPEKKNSPAFKANPLVWSAATVEQRVMVNKAILDAGVDIPLVIMCNNNDERRERATRLGLAWALAFVTPLITLPLTNRLAMKHVAKLTSGLTGKDAKLINLSNEFLKSADDTKKGVQALSKELKFDFSESIKKAGGDYEKLRQKMINAKMSVLSFDYLFTAGTLGGLAYWNVWYTKKKTGRDGFSAEFAMADKEVIDKRAASYKKYENLRKGIFLTGVALLTASPLLMKKGLSSKSTKGFDGWVKKHAVQFDYNDGIWMRRTSMLAAMGVGTVGTVMASRNSTELKDSSMRYAILFPAYFLGDLVIGSVFGRISDAILKTNIIDKNQPDKLWNKIFPQTTKIKNLTGQSQMAQACLFWLNIAILAGTVGFGVPFILNKMIRRDVQKDADKMQQPFQQQPQTDFKTNNELMNKLLDRSLIISMHQNRQLK